MPEISQGVETGGNPSDQDVNTDAGFHAAVTSAAGIEVSPEQIERIEGADTSVAGGLTTHEESAQTDQNRDEQGRFAPAAPQPEPVEGVAPEGDQVDPEIAALLERHGGDAVAALADLRTQAAEAQSLIGRHSGEVGELREQVARLEGRMEAQAQTPASQPVQLSQVSQDELESSVDRYGGRQTVIGLIQAGYDDGVIERAFATWAEFDDSPYEALAARQDYRLAVSAPQAAPAAEQTTDPNQQWVAQKRQQEQLQENMNAALGAVQTSLGADWEVVKPHLSEALGEAPELVQRAVTSDDPATQKQGVEALVTLARGRAIAAATAQVNEERAAQVRGTKQAAQVATGSLRPAQERKPEGEETREDRIARFHKALLSAESTSVHDNLVEVR